jgi:hypothetical protein
MVTGSYFPVDRNEEKIGISTYPQAFPTGGLRELKGV